MVTAFLFIVVCCFGYFLSLFMGPFWGVLVYANIYFNSPNPKVNWWGELIPFQRWSYLTTAVILVSMFLHRDRISSSSIKRLNLVISFLALTAFLTFTTSEFPEISTQFLTQMLSYVIICVTIVKVVKEKWQLRALWLWVVLLTANLSLNAYLYGKRVHGRLENIGTSDSVSSNLFGLLLGGVAPLMIPFICAGKRYERILCLLCLPFILNAMVLCNSRGSFVAIAGGFIAAYFFLADRVMKRKMRVLAVVLVALFMFLADQEMIERLSSLMSATEAMQDDQQANVLSSGRMEIWRYGMQMVGDHPFGAGPGGFKLLAKDYLPPEILTVHAEGETGVRGAHNSYLLVLVEQGPIGLMLWLVMCLSSCLTLYKASAALKYHSDADPFWRYAVCSMGVSIVTTLCGGLFTSRVYYEFFWWQIAMVVVLAYLVQMRESEPTCAHPVGASPSKVGS